MRSCPPDEPGGTRWDGSRPGGRPFRRALRLHPDAPTRLLRAAQLKPCTDCGNTLEWYYRDNGRPLPLHPRELPLAAVPEEHRWHVFEGVAHHGPDGTAWCRVPHRALCPAIEGPAPAQGPLVGLRRQLAVNTRRLQDSGRFTPPGAPASPPGSGPALSRPEARRDVVYLFHSLYLAPGAAEATPCVALTVRRTRCSNALAHRARDVGWWTVVPVPPGCRPGRQRELTDHLTGTSMAVYDLTALPYPSQLRWRAQHCTFHADSRAADIAVTAWEPFDPFAHHRHVTPVVPVREPPQEN
ncbi:DUF6083 domain-containing protein [Streptacidiphilus cavernicola]|uniref:DUF6083 domain-containing protein n=1 Tax=Streptacidiphilus cavernicola TaxID=3342716 RepID=A0ABV6W5S4_9ACTN